jgi:hypothetical protein
MKCLVGLLLFVRLFSCAQVLSAQSRFEGTWEMTMKTIELSGPPEEYLLENGMYHCITGVLRVDVEMNGKVQHVTGHANFDALAVRVVDANSVAFTQMRGGRPNVCMHRNSLA